MIRTVAGRYEIAAQIGQGSLCAVYRAHDTLLARTVAAKLLRPGLRGDAEAVARFEHGARIGATFTHPSLGHVFDAGRDPEAGPFFIQEYLPGQQLDALLPVVPTNALRWSAQIAEALALLHQHGLVHRAVAPEHIRITPDGRAVLFDFGLVGRAGAAASPVFGASYYGAPELAPHGSPAAAPTPAADVYALGVALHEMLTGSIPIYRQADQAEPEWRQVSALPPLRERLPAMVSTVERLLGRATACDPARRPAMAELAAELKALIAIAGSETAVIAPVTRRLTLTLPELEPGASLDQAADGHESPTVTVASLQREHQIDPQTLPTEVITPPSGIEARRPGSRQAGAGYAADGNAPAGYPLAGVSPAGVAGVFPGGDAPVAATEQEAGGAEGRRSAARAGWRQPGRLALAAGAALVALLGAGAWRSASSEQPAAPGEAPGEVILTGVGTQRLRTILPIVSAAPAPPADLAGAALDSDGFDSPRWAVARDRGWSLGYAESRYQMRMDPGVGILWSYSKQDAPAGNLALAIDVEPRAGQAGLLFGWRGGRDHYRLVTGADGGYRLEQRSGGEVITHLSGQGAGAGRLAVALRGNLARVYFNQQLLGEVALPAAPGGRYGMVVIGDGAGEALFDSLSLQAAP